MRKISTKVIVIITVITVFAVILTGSICFYQIGTQAEKNYETYFNALRDDYDALISCQVNNALSVLDQINNEYEEGVISLQEAQDRGADIIREMRYSESGYFWVDTLDGVNIVNLGKETEGKSRINTQDVNGVYTVKESNKLAQEGGGYLDYWWPKLGETEASPKRSYSALFEPWQWVVGTGNYIDDMELIAKDFEKENNESKQSMIKILILSICAVIGLSIIIAYIFGKKLAKPIVQLKDVANHCAETGDINVSFQVKTKDEISDLAKGFQSLLISMKEQAINAERIANGDLQINIEPKSEQDLLTVSMKKVVGELRNLVEELNHLTEGAISGDLSVKGNVKRFKGGYADIILGVNSTLDAVIYPLKMAADYIDKLSKGDIPDKIEKEYNGDYNVIKNNLNHCIDSINELVKDANYLVNGALAGQLDNRADVEKHRGDYAKVIGGFNRTMDAVIEPIQEASIVLDKIAEGKFDVRMVGDYKGDYQRIKTALNHTGEIIQSYIIEISDTLKDMANKNITGHIDREYIGDFKQLKDSINHIIEQFNLIFGEISVAAEQVEVGAGQVASSSQSLSQGASEQASSVEEIGATIAEVAEQTTENAQNAGKANELSIKAKEDAEIGNQQMKKMLIAMDTIKESSNNIANIIKVIEEIAFQTNILALNAAVEAARAGEHGKGFAVVAEEVRNLAARSAEAARETTDLIDTSILKVEEGYHIANETAEELDKIVLGVSDTVEIVKEIADASNHQATAIGEINRGIEQISDVTQNNTATAEESASASEEMAGQSQMLKQLIEAFKLKSMSVDSQYNQREITKEKQPVAEISLEDSDFGKY